MPRRAILPAIAWVCLVCVCAAQSLTFPALTGRVVDEAGVLDAETRTALTASLAALELKTTDQLVVVTLKSLQGTSIEDYGYQLGRHWQIGQKDKNNGVLLIVAPNERKVRIEVGYGLEGTLTDAVTKLIIEKLNYPAFQGRRLSRRHQARGRGHRPGAQRRCAGVSRPGRAADRSRQCPAASQAGGLVGYRRGSGRARAPDPVRYQGQRDLSEHPAVSCPAAPFRPGSSGGQRLLWRRRVLQWGRRLVRGRRRLGKLVRRA